MVWMVCHLPTDPISKNKIKPLRIFFDSFLREHGFVIGADTRLGESRASFQAPPHVRFFCFFFFLRGSRVDPPRLAASNKAQQKSPLLFLHCSRPTRQQGSAQERQRKTKPREARVCVRGGCARRRK